MRAGRTALIVLGIAFAAVKLPHAASDAVAHEAAVAGVRDEPAMVVALRESGARILALGERGGLSGHFVELADGDAYGLYLTPDGHAVAGLLYGPDGTLVTGRQIAAARGATGGGIGANTARPAVGSTDNHEISVSGRSHGGDEPLIERTLQLTERARLAHLYRDELEVPNGEAPDIEAPDTEVYTEVLFERSASAFGFTLGRSGPLVVLFADPACRWSRSAAARLGRAALDGRLQLRVIPVGVLGGDSVREAAAIASAPDPALAWFEGTGAPAGAEGARRIGRNNDLFDDWGGDAVPLTVWRARDGRIAHRLGDLDDAGAWLEALPHE